MHDSFQNKVTQIQADLLVPLLYVTFVWSLFITEYCRCCGFEIVHKMNIDIFLQGQLPMKLHSSPPFPITPVSIEPNTEEDPRQK